MNPRDNYGLPAWESEFWRDLLLRENEEVRHSYDDCTCEVCETPEVISEEYISPYATDDMIVGEIVEDDTLELERSN